LGALARRGAAGRRRLVAGHGDWPDLALAHGIAGQAVRARRLVRAFDGGQHVYIQMPPTVQASEVLALLVQSRGDESALVNYRVRLPHYVVDGLFAAAVLIVGDRVTIRRKADGQ
jgi:type IV secretion system protein TrbG